MRLIDADALMEKVIDSREDNPHSNVKLICNHRAEHLHFMNLIRQEPTAYDVDKVVEQLEDYLFDKYCVEGDGKISEILKEGGANE